uniref:Uncharacterized protein n=1 Tax=Timema shepardi TaxID=629360 RepID=A0A7R9FX67_TIMSH|nr:unnamed protein product [Timema shepardi]
MNLENMITLGCKRQQTAALALQIYIELCEGITLTINKTAIDREIVVLPPVRCTESAIDREIVVLPPSQVY